MRHWSILLAATVLSGCASVGIAENHVWSVSVEPRVSRGSAVHFTVKTADSTGKPVDGVKYIYVAVYKNVSSAEHTGTSGSEVRLLLKKAAEAGPATLRIFALNRAGARVQVAEGTFELY
jgi:hypothetical protein